MPVTDVQETCTRNITCTSFLYKFLVGVSPSLEFSGLCTMLFWYAIILTLVALIFKVEQNVKSAE